MVLAACVLFFTLTVTWGGMRLGAPMPGGGAAPLATYYTELAGFFLAGFLIVLVARSVSARTR